VRILALLLLTACPSRNPAREAVDAQKAVAPVSAAPAAETWTCPMHPEVVQDHPGKCPKCGMDLVKKGG
jgi:hypothetical protein